MTLERFLLAGGHGWVRPFWVISSCWGTRGDWPLLSSFSPVWLLKWLYFLEVLESSLRSSSRPDGEAQGRGAGRCPHFRAPSGRPVILELLPLGGELIWSSPRHGFRGSSVVVAGVIPMPDWGAARRCGLAGPWVHLLIAALLCIWGSLRNGAPRVVQGGTWRGAGMQRLRGTITFLVSHVSQSACLWDP